MRLSKLILGSEWEKYKKFEDMSDDKIASLTLEEYNRIGEQSDRRNAWSVAREVTL